jgi:hypothetical protein
MSSRRPTASPLDDALASFGGALAANDPANIARRVPRQRNAITCDRLSGSSIGQPRRRHRWGLRTANAPTTTHATSTTPSAQRPGCR